MEEDGRESGAAGHQLAVVAYSDGQQELVYIAYCISTFVREQVWSSFVFAVRARDLAAL